MPGERQAGLRMRNAHHDFVRRLPLWERCGLLNYFSNGHGETWILGKF
jgi:hypothetical protein